MAGSLTAAVPFVHPAIAGLALALGALPILIHLIFRRRYRRMPWAAMSFLLAAAKRSARRLRLEQWLLLLARIAAVVLLGFAVARPFLPWSAALPLAGGRVHRILLIDNSGSMNAVGEGGTTRLERARNAALALLESLPRDDTFTLVTLAAPAGAPVAYPSSDRRLLREQIATLPSTQRLTDVQGGVARAREILADASAAPGNVLAYVISDFAAPQWHPARPGETPPAIEAINQLGEDVPVTLVRVEPGQEQNIAVTDVALETRLSAVNVPIGVTAELTNFGPAAVRNVALQVERDRTIVRRFGRGELPPIEPGERIRVTFSMLFPTPGAHQLLATVSTEGPDALEPDNMRHVSVEISESTEVLLVDGRPGDTLLTGSAGYLATALSPALPEGEERPAPVRAAVITEAELPTEVLGDYQLVGLCNVARLPEAQWTALARYVGDGGALLVTAGDLVHADNYNQHGYAAGNGVLPAALGARALPEDDPNAAVQFDRKELLHTIVRDFAEQPDSGLFLARVRQYLAAEPDAQRGRVVLRYSDGGAALILGGYGRGKTALLTTSADMTWSNLPARGDFVSLVSNLAAYLTGERGDRRNAVVGQTLHEPLTAQQSAQPIRIRKPDGALEPGTLVAEGDALALQFGPVERAGLYTVVVGTQPEGPVFAVNVDPEESDVRTAATAELAGVAGGGVRVISEADLSQRAAEAGRVREYAGALLYLAAALLLAETWMAMWFSANRQRRDSDRITRGEVAA